MSMSSARRLDEYAASPMASSNSTAWTNFFIFILDVPAAGRAARSGARHLGAHTRLHALGHGHPGAGPAAVVDGRLDLPVLVLAGAARSRERTGGGL